MAHRRRRQLAKPPFEVFADVMAGLFLVLVIFMLTQSLRHRSEREDITKFAKVIEKVLTRLTTFEQEKIRVPTIKECYADGMPMYTTEHQGYEPVEVIIKFHHMIFLRNDVDPQPEFLACFNKLGEIIGKSVQETLVQIGRYKKRDPVNILAQCLAIEVEGHTDPDPVERKREAYARYAKRPEKFFENNLELSAKRAAAAECLIRQPVFGTPCYRNGKRWIKDLVCQSVSADKELICKGWNRLVSITGYGNRRPLPLDPTTMSEEELKARQRRIWIKMLWRSSPPDCRALRRVFKREFVQAGRAAVRNTQ